MRKHIIALLILLLYTADGIAQTGSAGMPGSFLHMGVGAQALGMGKAYTALATDPTALYWNPAGYASQNPFQFYMMHSTLFLDTNMDYFAATFPMNKVGNFGLGVMALSSKGFEQRSVLNEDLGSFNMMDMAVLLSWSKEIYYDLAVGLNYKLVNQKIMSFSGNGHGMDIGLKKTLFDRFGLGLVFTNVLKPKMKIAEYAENYPMQFRFGMATSFFDNKLTVATDVAKIPGWGKTSLNFGIEIQPMRNLAIRSGFENERFTLGVGLSMNNYGIDYSSAQFAELGASHRYALKYSFGGFQVKAIASPDVFSPIGEMNVSRIKLKVKSRSVVSKWMFEIVDEAGVVIRNFAESGEIPQEIIWDGRDNNGLLMNDGTFSYRLEVLTEDGKNLSSNGTLVSIDTKGPSGSLGFNKDD